MKLKNIFKPQYLIIAGASSLITLLTSLAYFHQQFQKVISPFGYDISTILEPRSIIEVDFFDKEYDVEVVSDSIESLNVAYEDRSRDIRYDVQFNKLNQSYKANVVHNGVESVKKGNYSVSKKDDVTYFVVDVFNDDGTLNKKDAVKLRIAPIVD